MTMEQIKQELLSENALIECTCETVIDEETGEEKVIKCEKCQQLEWINNMCLCGKCRSCLNLLIERLKREKCECTYKTIQETIITEDGVELIVDKEVLDVKCARCIEIDGYKEKLDWYDMFEKAYIPESEWDKCSVVDGVIVQPNDEPLHKSEIEVLKRDVASGQFVQDAAIDTIMFTVIPSIESRLPQTKATRSEKNITINLMKGLVVEMGAYFADRIIREVVTYKQCFSISFYKPYREETDLVLRLQGYGHLIVPIE